jgi:hypothetical protein
MSNVAQNAVVERMFSAIALCLSAELRRNHIEDVPKEKMIGKAIYALVFYLEKAKMPMFFGCL